MNKFLITIMMVLVLIVPVSADGTVAGELGFGHGYQAGEEGTPEAYADNPYDPELNETEYYDYVMGYAAGWLTSFPALLVTLQADGEVAGRVQGYADGLAPVSYDDVVTEFPDICTTIDAQLNYQYGFSIGYEARYNEGDYDYAMNSLATGQDAGYDDGINGREYNGVVPAGYQLQAYQSGYANGYNNAEDEILQEEDNEAYNEEIRVSIRAGKDAGYDDGINGREYNNVAPDDEPHKGAWERGYHMRHNPGISKYWNAQIKASQNIPVIVSTSTPIVNNTNTTADANITADFANTSVNITNETMNETLNNTFVINVTDEIDKEPTVVTSIITHIKNFLRGLFPF